MTHLVVALAGRRIDSAEDINTAFPLGAIPSVSREIEAYLRRIAPVAMFSAAACGADIIALRAAKSLGIEAPGPAPFEFPAGFPDRHLN